MNATIPKAGLPHAVGGGNILLIGLALVLVVLPPKAAQAQDIGRTGLREAFYYRIYCWDGNGNPASGVNLYLTLGVGDYTGWHSCCHDLANRPKGTIAPTQATTGPDGFTAGLRFDPPGQANGEIAGQHYVFADAPGYQASYMNVQVRNDVDLAEVPPGAKYLRVGDTSPHPYNWYGTENTVSKIQTICNQFYDQTNGTKAGINDISLEWGGRFDLGPSYTCANGLPGVWWDRCHYEHHYGRSVDIPFGYLGAYKQTFKTIAENNGATVGTEGTHYHLTFAN